MAQLDAVSQITRLWNIRFLDGQARSIPHDKIAKGNLPLIWVRDDGNDLDIRIILGIQNKGFLVENSEGVSEYLEQEQISEGKAVQLFAGTSDLINSDESEYSAKDWFFFAIKKRRAVFFEAVFGTFMVSIFGLMSALYTMQVYDRVVPTNGFSTLWVLTIGVLLAIAFEFAMKLVRAQMVDRASKAIDTELSSVFFGKALDIRADPALKRSEHSLLKSGISSLSGIS